MSALPQPDFRDYNSNWKSPTRTQKTSSKKAKNVAKTTRLSRKKRPSATLQLLRLLQKSTSSLAAVMMLGSIGVYLSTVRIPQLWSQEYENLETLQRQERDLVAVDESLKYEIAKQAEESALAMSAISPENTVFLDRVDVKPQVAEKELEKKQPRRSIRLGY